MTSVVSPSLQELRAIVNLADHLLQQDDDMDATLHKDLGTAVEDTLEWIEALEAMTPASEIAMAQAVLAKHGAPANKLPFAVSKMLSLSTAHLEKATADALTNGFSFGQTVYDKDVYGWWIALPDLSDPPEEVESPSLRAVLERAKLLGCEWLMLDSDAEILDDLPSYDW